VQAAIVVSTTPAALAAKKATSTIPIIIAAAFERHRLATRLNFPLHLFADEYAAALLAFSPRSLRAPQDANLGQRMVAIRRASIERIPARLGSAPLGCPNEFG
jgi:hypothetical protein